GPGRARVHADGRRLGRAARRVHMALTSATIAPRRWASRYPDADPILEQSVTPALSKPAAPTGAWRSAPGGLPHARSTTPAWAPTKPRHRGRRADQLGRPS